MQSRSRATSASGNQMRPRKETGVDFGVAMSSRSLVFGKPVAGKALSEASVLAPEGRESLARGVNLDPTASRIVL
jgi:hypothetical protein